MFARLSVVCLMLSLPTAAHSDDTDVKKTAKAKAEEIQTALVKGDLEKVADLTHPKVVTGLGGKEKMVARMKKEIEAMKGQGSAFKSAKILDPSEPITAGKELYIGIPFDLEMTVTGGRLLSRGFLVGVSSDGGKSWTFVDGVPGRDKIKELLPNLPDALVFPKREPRTLIKD
jgi:hypothetical protein